eukprot:1684466-Rhodomonas_salina.2
MLRVWEKVDRLERRTVALETRVDARAASLESKMDLLLRSFKGVTLHVQRSQQHGGGGGPSAALAAGSSAEAAVGGGRRFSGQRAPLPADSLHSASAQP